MNILIITPHFYPENFRINDFALNFKNKGHHISVLTAIPDYPEGKFYKGYGFFNKNRSIYKGIKIYRSPIISRGSGSNIRLAIQYISFIFGSIFTSLFFLRNKIDIIYIFGVSPITVALPGIFLKKIKKIPICLWLLDLWPESVISAGNIKPGLITKILNRVVKFIYKHSDKILVSSEGFIDLIVKQGVNKNKLEFFPQWAESIFRPTKKPKNYFNNIIPKNCFKIMFAGNIGEAQDFPAILETAKLLKEKKNIQWIIVGNGSKAKWLKNKVNEYKLNKSFQILGTFPLDEMPKLYAYADVMLFSLKNDDIFSITIPGKVQSYLACGKPILAMANGESAKIINENNAGYTCNAGNYNSLADNILKMSRLAKSSLEDLANNSLLCYNTYFERDMLLQKAENIFYKLAS